jgi:hypothetical protein
MAWTADTARAALARAGVAVDASELRLEPREERRFTRLPGGRIAWFADSPDGRRRLVLERRVLRLVGERCTFRVPRVLFESDDGSFDVRLAVAGATDPMLDAALAVYEPALGLRLSRERIALYNTACAVSFLAYRDGIPADRLWCGRTLAKDLAWTQTALARVGV